MKKRLPLVAGLLVVFFASLGPTFVEASAATTSTITNAVASSAAVPGFVNPAFQDLWLKTDLPVETGKAVRSFLWGPAVQAAQGQFAEFYDNSPNNYRLVQYFDKTRMEVNNRYANPSGDFYVSNGLLVAELISGYQQEGDTRFRFVGPAEVPIAGDPGEVNPLSPVYASFRNVASTDQSNPLSKAATNQIGKRTTGTINKAGDVGNDPTKAGIDGTDIVYYDSSFGHNIPRKLWDYLNQVGPTLAADGSTLVQGQKVFNWVSAMGFPITEPYWTQAMVAGKPTDVLVQAFQRRVLTYTPSNPKEFQVEMGNVGQHYYKWRFPSGPRNYIPPRDVPLQAPHISYGIGAHLYYEDRTQINNQLKDLGVRWVVQKVSWRDIEVNGQPGVFIWDELDRVVDSLYSNGIHTILVPKDTPNMYKDNPNSTQLPNDVSAYGRFMAAMAQRYRLKVDAYEIWNEENLSWEVGAPISLQRYVKVLAVGSEAVKANDPWAFVILGALSPTGVTDANSIDDVEYLKKLYEYNNGEVLRNHYFDVLGAHPGNQCNPPDNLWPSNPTPANICSGWKDHQSFYFRRIEGLHQVMADHGDATRQIWLTEFGWASSKTISPSSNYSYALQVSEQQQADYIKRAFEKAQADYPYMGVMALWNLNFWKPSLRPDSSDVDGSIAYSIFRRDGTKRPAYDVVKALATAVKP
ncbi:MAG: cellulase family glycosylhydrolase [Chloroflexi bacterium]|uniref:Cellulase family glycosylhydrolase n=1 Tax=Candidatus Chlorohelix allophototropha TaxID=3003348 RepID=A0A8T7LYE9_9CHLR|nr:cellulase family glycosylhydrolase [Chloroflexota bacterium]WJW66253.1 cellulase family glycosylhydrolase [Chloroflexota bacterium L227-S17]